MSARSDIWFDGCLAAAAAFEASNDPNSAQAASDFAGTIWADVMQDSVLAYLDLAELQRDIADEISVASDGRGRMFMTSVLSSIEEMAGLLR